MAEIYNLIRESGGFSTLLLALSGSLFLAYLLALLALVVWHKVRGR